MRVKHTSHAPKTFIEATSIMTPLWPNWKSLAKTLPNDASVFELKGYIERRQGKQEEAVRSLERAIDLDPRNSFHAAADCAQLSSSAPFRRAKIGFGPRAGYRAE